MFITEKILLMLNKVLFMGTFILLLPINHLHTSQLVSFPKLQEVTESSWEQIEPLPLVQHRPNFQELPTFGADIRVAYTADALYVRGSFALPQKEIRAGSYKRDYLNTDTDYLFVVLDTFNDNEHAMVFGTAPTGLRIDFALANDASGNKAFFLNKSWDAYWNSTTKITSEGWEATIRIPFSSLRFQQNTDVSHMGITLIQYVTHRNEVVTYPEIPPQWGFWSPFKPSQTINVTFSGIAQKSPVYFRPYFSGGIAQDARLNDLESAYKHAETIEREIGLDFKYGLTSNLILDATFNPDFAQVEADDQQVNLTRHSLFFPEKRFFFQDQAGKFLFQTGEMNRLFHSRRIGIQNGQEVDIIGGIRTAGRIGDWDIGILNVQTDEDQYYQSENMGVCRVRRQAFNPYSYLGGIITTRIESPEKYNIIQGIDGVIRAFGYDYFEFQLAQTLDSEYATNRLFEPAQVKYRVFWEKRKYEGFAYHAGITRIGEQFNPKLGFERRTNVTRTDGMLSYGWIPETKSKIQRHRIRSRAITYNENQSEILQSAEVNTEWIFQLNSGSEYGLIGLYRRENILSEFRLSQNARIPSGKYTFMHFSGKYNSKRGGPVQLSSIAGIGEFFDGHRVNCELKPQWIISPHLKIELAYEYNHVRFPARDQLFNSHITRCRIGSAINVHWMSDAFLQYNSINHLIVLNFRLRYQPSEGSDLYIVYNENLNSNRNRIYPELPWTDNRTFLIKYNHTFEI